MNECAEKMQFEKAAQLRDRIKAISRISESQKVVFSKVANQDIIALARSEQDTCAVVLKFRGERLVDKQDFLLGAVDDLDGARLEFLLRYYTTREDIPKRVQLDGEIEDVDIAAQLLSEQAGHRVEIRVPQRGEQQKLVEMARANAAERLSQKAERTGREVAALDELARLLGLSKPPAYIEAYDISNIGSDTVVGGMVVFENGAAQTCLLPQVYDQDGAGHRRLREHVGGAFPAVRPLFRRNTEGRGVRPDARPHPARRRKGARLHDRAAARLDGGFGARLRHGQGRPAPHPRDRRVGRRDCDQFPPQRLYPRVDDPGRGAPFFHHLFPCAAPEVRV